MEAGVLGNYCLSEHLGCFFIIYVRIYISCFSVMYPFLAIAMMHSRILYLDCFLEYERSSIALSQTVKNATHSSNGHGNDVDPGGKPDKIEDLLFALSGQSPQVRPLGEK